MGRCHMFSGASFKSDDMNWRSRRAPVDMCTVLCFDQARLSLLLMVSFLPKGFELIVVLMYLDKASWRLMLKWSPKGRI